MTDPTDRVLVKQGAEAVILLIYVIDDSCCIKHIFFFRPPQQRSKSVLQNHTDIQSSTNPLPATVWLSKLVSFNAFNAQGSLFQHYIF
jgi:hypothetical protein